MPHYALHQLASDMVEHVRYMNPIVISNSARCGSTLLCKMFDQVPGIRVYSEPFALAEAHQVCVIEDRNDIITLFIALQLFNKGTIHGAKYTQLVRSLLRLQFKREVNRSYQRLVVKMPMICMPQVGFMTLSLFIKLKWSNSVT